MANGGCNVVSYMSIDSEDTVFEHARVIIAKLLRWRTDNVVQQFENFVNKVNCLVVPTIQVLQA